MTGLSLGFVSLHLPLYAPQKWFDLYPEEQDIVLPPAPEGDRDDIPDFAWYTHWFLPEPRLSWVMEHDQWHSKVRSYLATISFVDAQVGRVLDALEGISLVPLLENAATPRERPAVTTANPGNHAVRTERWRYIRYANGSEELYDHHRDPHEWSNLAQNSEFG